MAAPRRVIELAFSDENVADLLRIARSRTAPASRVERALVQRFLETARAFELRKPEFPRAAYDSNFGNAELDRGKPRDEDTEGGNQPADKSLINRRLSLRSQLCAAMAFLADGGPAERALNRAFPLDREHKRLDRQAKRACGADLIAIGFLQRLKRSFLQLRNFYATPAEAPDIGVL